MANRIVSWHIPNPGASLPRYYMDRDYTPEKVRIMAETAPVTEFDADIRNDGTSILENRALSHRKIRIVPSTIAYNTLSGVFQDGETITGGSSGAIGRVVHDTRTSMTLTLDRNTVFTAAETITGSDSAATAVVSGFTRGAYHTVLSDDPARYGVILPMGETVEDDAEDFPDSVSTIEKGSVLTCHVNDMGGANNVTVQLELVSIEND